MKNEKLQKQQQLFVRYNILTVFMLGCKKGWLVWSNKGKVGESQVVMKLKKERVEKKEVIEKENKGSVE